MLPIYSLLPFLFLIVDYFRYNIIIKSIFITICILLIEYFSCYSLRNISICPWEENYKKSNSNYSLHNLVRLDYIPFWYFISIVWYKLWGFLKYDSNKKIRKKL